MTDADATPAAHPTPPHRTLRSRLTGRTAGRGLLAAVALWTIIVSFSAQGWAWALAETPDSRVSAGVIQALLIGLPVVPLAIFWRLPRTRGAFRGWAWAVAYLLLLTPTRYWLPVQGQSILLAQIALTVAAWLVVRRFVRYRPPTHPASLALALGAGALAILPWLRGGALGSLLDSILAVALAIAFGHLVWTVHLATWIPPQRRDPRTPRRDRLTGGLVLGVTLLIMSSALGHNGAQLLLMAALPAAAWLVAATGAPAWGIAVVAAAPLLFIDPDAVNLIAGDSLLFVYFGAAFWSVMIAWGAAAASLWPQPDPYRLIPRSLAWAGGLIGIALVMLTAVTTASGGFHGDRLFVVMADQADLGERVAVADVDERRLRLYQSMTAHADRTQTPLRADLARWGVAYTPYYLVNGLEVEGGLPLALWLRSRADVAEVLPSPVLRPLPDWVEGDPLADLLAEGRDTTAPDGPPWNLMLIGADRVWNEWGVTGAGIVIGQSDSGVQFDHPQLAASYRGAGGAHDYHWYDPWFGSRQPEDRGGHGTHTLGTVLGAQVGVAPGATWFACANLPRNLGNPAKYLDCLQFMFAPFPLDGDPLQDGDPARAAHVLNNSWGCPAEYEGCSATLFEPAVAALRQGGIFVVVSAGNEGPACASLDAPLATHAGVMSVGALDAQGNLARFSSVGPVTVDGSNRVKPDLVAPGVDILSAVPGDGYASWDGTSMAGPHVAGVVALMWSANPALVRDIAATEQILIDTARPFTGTLQADSGSIADACLSQIDLPARPNVVAGYGVVDAFAAVQAALAAR